MKPGYVAIVLTLLTGIFPFSVIANDNPSAPSEDIVRYQEVFFHFYRKDSFNALVNLSAGIEKKNIIDNRWANELLLGNLYSMYQLPEQAETRLLSVVNAEAGERQKDLARFYLAKVYFEQKRYPEFFSAIEKTGKHLPPALVQEKYYMTGMVYLEMKQLENTIDMLDEMDVDNDHYHYLAFNLGAAYFTSGEVKKGEKLIRKIGEDQYDSEDMLSLRDKSNIVLGYYYLREVKPDEAVAVLENVRLDGPFSNKALLGLGWAYSQLNKFRKALVPWLTLAEKSALDVTVQEAKLASAFAYRQLGAERKAMLSYKKSIDEYESVKKYYQHEISNAFNHNIFSSLVNRKRNDDFATTQALKKLIKTREGEVLFDLLSEEKFQQLFSDYRDLRQLQDKLAQWRHEIERMHITLDSLQSESVISKYQTTSRSDKPKEAYRELLLTLNDTVELQNDRLEILLTLHEEKIRDEYVRALNRKQQYLIAYLSQARFALAEILDKARQKNE